MRARHSLSLALFALASLTGCPSPSPSDAGPDAPASDAFDASDAPFDASNDTVDATDASAPDVMAAWLVPYTPTPRAHFPASFMWGAATAPYQIEGMLDATDWGEWEQRGQIVNGDRADNGPQSLAHYADDVTALSSAGFGWYRFGIEMARLFPTREAWDACRTATEANRLTACRAAASASGLAYYHTLLDTLHAHAIQPLVTLQHFVFPSYLNDLTADYTTQGWLRDGVVDDLGVYASFVAAEYGAQVDWWVTINEPLVFATAAYLDGRFPPGRHFELTSILHVVNNMVHAHVAMYDAIHRADTVTAATSGPLAPLAPAYVGIAHHVIRLYGDDPADARDTQAAARADQLFNHMFVDAIIRGNLDANANGTLDPGEPMNDPALRGRADYFGMNYYSLATVKHLTGIPLLGGLPQPQRNERGLPKNDLGWDLFPRGMFDALQFANSYGLPVVITENGIADATDANRPRYLAEHLAAVAAAIQAGVNVIGYFHWSLMDNFEWVSGYCPRFGLYATDYSDPNRARTARPSVSVLHQIITAGEVTDAVLSAQPAYHTPSTFCADTIPGDGGT